MHGTTSFQFIAGDRVGVALGQAKELRTQKGVRKLFFLGALDQQIRTPACTCIFWEESREKLITMPSPKPKLPAGLMRCYKTWHGRMFQLIVQAPGKVYRPSVCIAPTQSPCMLQRKPEYVHGLKSTKQKPHPHSEETEEESQSEDDQAQAHLCKSLTFTHASLRWATCRL